METNNSFDPECHRRICFFCKRFFEPFPTVRTRQYACRREECQALRQRLNELDWHQRHQFHDDKWYQDYYKPWRQRQPDYQKRYRQQMKTLSDAVKVQMRRARQKLKCLLRDFQMFQAEYKERLHVLEQRDLAAARAVSTGPLVCAHG